MAKVFQGGYDRPLEYRRVEMRPAEQIIIGENPRYSTWHHIVPPPDDAFLRDTYRYETIVYVRNQYAVSLWHSDHIEVDDRTPVIIDIGWMKVYTVWVWEDKLTALKHEREANDV